MSGDISQWTGTWLDCTGVLVSSQSSVAQVDSRSNISSDSWARADRYKALLCFLYGFHSGGGKQQMARYRGLRQCALLDFNDTHWDLLLCLYPKSIFTFYCSEYYILIWKTS